LGIEEEELQAKGVENVKIIVEKLPNPEKHNAIQVQEAFKQPKHKTRKEPPQDIS
jgi:predicted secreted protein